jgi:DNA-binding XRE family transcriptional regulator
MDNEHPLRKWRRTNGIGQVEVGKLVGVSASQISQIESGAKGCSLEVAVKLSRLASIPVDSFIRQAGA